MRVESFSCCCSGSRQKGTKRAPLRCYQDTEDTCQDLVINMVHMVAALLVQLKLDRSTRQHPHGVNHGMDAPPPTE